MESARACATRLGDPVLGLAGSGDGWLCTHTAPPMWPYLTLQYGEHERFIQVSTGRHSFGGTQTLVEEVLRSAAQGAGLPLHLAVEERLIMLRVLGKRMQFRVIESSNGHWIAVGGYRRRHLRLRGMPGTMPDELELVSVILP